MINETNDHAEYGEGLYDIVKVLNYCGAIKIATEVRIFFLFIFFIFILLSLLLYSDISYLYHQIEQIAASIISGGVKGIINIAMKYVIHITHDSFDLTEDFLVCFFPSLYVITPLYHVIACHHSPFPFFSTHNFSYYFFFSFFLF